MTPTTLFAALVPDRRARLALMAALAALVALAALALGVAPVGAGASTTPLGIDLMGAATRPPIA
jgi:hypothetical protein